MTSENKEWITIGKLQVDSKLFEHRSISRCVLSECQGSCCGHGVWVDLAHASQIIEEADLVKPHLPPDRRDMTLWFTREMNNDLDFPSGYGIGTDVMKNPSHPIGTHCVFLRPDHRCALQVAGIAAGRHPWDLKPFYCALYPIMLTDNQVYLDDDNSIYQLGGSCSKPETTSAPLYELYKDELVLALGPDGYAKLCDIAHARGKP